jgi:hypothetical protein
MPKTTKVKSKKTSKTRKIHSGRGGGFFGSKPKSYKINIPNISFDDIEQNVSIQKIQNERQPFEEKLRVLSEQFKLTEEKNKPALEKQMSSIQRILDRYTQTEQLERERVLQKQSEEQVHVFFIDGLGCVKNDQSTTDFFRHGEIDADKELTVVCESSTQTKLETTKHFGTIAKTTCALKPLQGVNDKLFLYDIANQILQKSAQNKDGVYVYGFSFGGMIVNRIVEILVKELETSGIRAQNKNVDKLLQNIHFATFGSIYITKNFGSLDIINYIAVGDVANTCTRFIKHKQFVSEKKLEKKYTKLSLETIYGITKKLLYKERSQNGGEPKIYDLCFYSNNEDAKPTCTQFINMAPIFRVAHEWDIHNNYYLYLIIYLVKNRTNNIQKLISEERVENIDADIPDNSDNGSVSEASEEDLELQSVFIPGNSVISNRYGTTK